MKNVTITLTEDVARWARVWAAEHETSVSRMLGNLLQEEMARETAYNTAMSAFLNRAPSMLKESGEVYPSREALHER